MNVKSLTLPLLLLVLGIATPAAAATVTVSDVRVRADDTFGVDPTEAVLAMCSVTKGMTAEQSTVQETISADVKALLATPFYSRVDAAIGQDDQGNWVVIYTVSRRPQLAAAPAFAGLDGTIRESKAEDAVKLTANARVDDAIAAAAAGRLRQALEDYGYVDATVGYEIRHADEPGYAYLTFLIEGGERRKIRDYNFEGNTAFDHDTLAETFGWRPIWNPISWFTDFPTSDAKLDDARAAVNNLYVEAGYLDAEVATPVLTQIEGKAKGRCDALFRITEGPRYTVGTITVEGAKVYPKVALEAAAREALARAKDGDFATQATLDAIRDAVEEYYGSRGYVDTVAHAEARPRDDAPVIDLTYHLTEGEQVRVRDILIRGNAITQDKVIRRELAIQPGEFYDSRWVKRSEARVRNLNYFQEESGVTSYTVKTPNAGERDLVFEVRERETGEYGFGLGVSTIDSIFVYAKATQSNFDILGWGKGFRGAGQRASAEAEIGGRRQTVLLSWTQPWLFDMPVALTIDAYRRMRWRDNYDEIRTGAAFTLAWKPAPIATPFGELQLDRIGLRYTLEHVTYDDEDEGVWYRANGAPFRFTDQEEGINSKLRFFWQEDHRDRPLFPTRGWSSQVYAEVGLFGEAKDYGLGFSFNKYTNPWLDHILSARFRFDTIEAYSGDVPMFDRFFIGGGRTVRGFEFRDGGPKAWNGGGHVAVGGQTLWCATVEYAIPLVETIHFAVFSDIGAVGEDFFDLGSDLLWSAGFGLRLNLPKFPIRLDVAFPITNDDNTEEETFTFWIGID